jgi:hypothetical protein
MAKKGMKAEPKGASESEGKAMGKGNFANMPTEVKMEMYPKTRYASDSLDDTMREIDSVVGKSEGKRSKYVSSQH